MTDKTSTNQIRKKGLAILLGSTLSRSAFGYLLVFIILAEFVVVPAQTILHQVASDVFGPNSNPYYVSLAELTIALLFAAFLYFMAKRTYDNWQTTLPLSIDEKSLKETNILKTQQAVCLFISLSNAFNRQTDRHALWEEDFSQLPKLHDHSFKENWDKSAHKDHNWRQPLLLLNAYLIAGNELTVYMVCSKESIKEYASFKTVCKELCDNKDKLNIKMFTELLEQPKFDQIKNNGLDFDDIDSVAKALDSAVLTLENTENAQKIVIDVTGGTKVTSIAGAIVSFARDRSFQYTLRDSGKIKHYQARYGESESQ